jgi:hypothetical protein
MPDAQVSGTEIPAQNPPPSQNVCVTVAPTLVSHVVWHSVFVS